MQVKLFWIQNTISYNMTFDLQRCSMSSTSVGFFCTERCSNQSAFKNLQTKDSLVIIKALNKNIGLLLTHQDKLFAYTCSLIHDRADISIQLLQLNIHLLEKICLQKSPIKVDLKKHNPYLGLSADTH